MFLPLLMLYRGYLNLLLVISPVRLFATIVRADVYHNLLVEWANTFIPREKSSILEVGCGPGLLACHLAAQEHEVTGIDLSKSMILRAKQISEAKGLAVNFSQADACQTGLPESTYDAVMGASIVNALNDRLPIMKEALRLLKPNGCVSFLFPTPEMTGKAVYRFATENNYSPFSTAVLITWATKAPKINPDTVRDLLGSAGFNGYRYHSVMNDMVAAVTAFK
jgi:2-polyprenyl-3-methyl-5-hydroxy-6-metoxy-1,4-benzoquinol methylase